MSGVDHTSDPGTSDPGTSDPGTSDADTSDPDTGIDTGLDSELLDALRFGPDGLIPAVVQQHDTREVLMVAWMDAEALTETLTTRRGTYFSRSRQERWRKGDTSGHVQHVVRVSSDCDGDTLLVEVDQVGPACHTGTRSCFDGRVVLDPAEPAGTPAP